MLRTRHLASVIAAALLFSSAAAATDFSKVIVFGDSLSDAGNISLASAPGIQPPLEFTTNPGHVALQDLADHFGYSLTPSLLGGTDYAWGGAGIFNNSPSTPSLVPTVTAQVNAYLAGGQVDSKALYSIWGGANDIFYHATSTGAAAAAQQKIAQILAATLSGIPLNMQPAYIAQVTAQVDAAVEAQAGVTSLETSDQAQAAIAAAAQQEVKLIGQLQGAGVKNILVFNLPNIGTTPDAAAQGPAAAAGLTGLSVVFNSQLNYGLGQLGTGIIPVNAYGLLSEVVANPAAYGFSNAVAPACGAGSTSVQCGPQGSGLPYTYAPGTDQSYVFADGVHPTTAAHALLTQYVVSILQAPEQISLLSEAPMATSAAQTHAIREQMLTDTMGGESRTFVNIDYGQQRFDASNGAPKTNSNNFNLTLGADAHVNDHLSAGVALGIGQANASFQDIGGGYKLQDISGLGYLTYHSGGGYIGGYANFGQSNFNDINRIIQLGAMRRTETGKADGSHLGAGLTGGWWFDFSSLRTGPFATVEWQTVKVNGYTEDGNDSSSMWFGRQQRDALVGTLGWRLQGNWNVGNTVLSPYAELAWNHDNKAAPGIVTAGLASMNGTFELTGFTPDKTWGTASLGLSAKLTSSMTSWIGYSGRFSDNSQKYNSFNMGFRVTF